MRTPSLLDRKPYYLIDKKLPRGIPIELPNYGVDPVAGPAGIPILTSLFREGSLPAQALMQIYRRRPRSTELSIVFGGCSAGTEVDSTAAVHNKSRFGGRLALTGLDISVDALNIAKAGKYVLSPHHLPIHGYGAGRKAERALRKYDFIVTPGPCLANLSEGGAAAAAYRQVDAAPVRRGHEVVFEKQDLREGGSIERPADLVFVNNLLYHLKPDEATEVVLNLASIMSKASVLSLGAGQRNIAEFAMGDHETPYSYWVSGISDQLASMFAAQPIMNDELGYPAMFSIN